LSPRRHCPPLPVCNICETRGLERSSSSPGCAGKAVQGPRSRILMEGRLAHSKYVLGSLAILSLAGCMSSTDKPSVSAPSGANDCPVSRSTNWQAWLEAPAGPSRQRMLHISGEIDLPTSGYSVALEAGPADRAMPPSQRFRLKAKPPSGMVTQVVTPTRVIFHEAATYPAYRSITILCDQRVLATITEVPAR
jgi:hypothetical protein